MPLPLAHETWFTDDAFAPDWAFAGQTATLVLLGLALALTLAVRGIARVWNGRDVPALGRLLPWMPFALRIHLAVSLVGLLSMGVYLSPSMDLRTSVPSIVLGVSMGLVAISMATGYRMRAGAWLLVALGPLGMLEFGIVPVLARLDLLGLAAFLLFTGPGAWSADSEQGREREPGVADFARAVWALRIALGAALVVVAFQEKLAVPAMAADFLAQHEQFNVANSLLGLGWSDAQFTRAAGVVEVLFGLLLISGRLPQLVVLAAGVPFNATLWFFGTGELIGHLPVYGAMLVLLVLGSHPALREAVGAAWPFGRPVLARGGRGAPEDPAVAPPIGAGVR